MKLNTKAFALSGGILWAASMFVFTIIAVATGYAFSMMEFFTGIYPGYSVTYAGAILGALYGFVDAFIGLYIFAWLYNKLAK